MKITAIGHAALLIEAAGVTILTDPWWRGPCFGAQWWNYPPPNVSSVEGRRIDYIYVSHGHHDHLHPGTLRTLNSSGKVLVSRQLDIAPSVRELGFEVIEIGDNDALPLGSGVTCRVMGTHGDDTLMAIDDGQEVCINLNDALHSAPRNVQTKFVTLLKELYPRIDYVFCGYGVASHFPNCYDIPGKNREATASRRQRHFNRSWAHLIAALDPRFGFPFAADVVFLEDDLFWVNEPTHNSERPTQTFAALYPKSRVRTLDIAPGFSIDSGVVMTMALRQPILAGTLRSACGESIERANRQGSVSEGDVLELVELMRRNLKLCEAYLRGYEHDYRFLIVFRNSQLGIRIDKAGGSIDIAAVENGAKSKQDFDIVYRTRLPYLKWSYSKPYGEEILFVGSGGIFEYRDQVQAGRNLHRELKVLLTRQTSTVPARGDGGSGLLHWVKRTVKRAIGRDEQDLYDLGAWTVFGEP